MFRGGLLRAHHSRAASIVSVPLYGHPRAVRRVAATQGRTPAAPSSRGRVFYFLGPCGCSVSTVHRSRDTVGAIPLVTKPRHPASLRRPARSWGDSRGEADVVTAGVSTSLDRN